MANNGQTLSPGQQKFIEQYLLTDNATKAAILAGYSPKTARAQGSRLLTFVDIQQAIDQKRKRLLEKLEITTEKVLSDLETARELAIEHKQFGPAIRASQLHGKYLGMFEERHQPMAPVGIQIIIGNVEQEIGNDAVGVEAIEQGQKRIERAE